MAKKKPKIKSLVFIGRRWFQKMYGNTYHTVSIYVNGKCVCRTGKQYGYGDQYIYTAWDWLRTNGYVPQDSDTSAPWRWCQERKIALTAEVVDVAREKDL